MHLAVWPDAGSGKSLWNSLLAFALALVSRDRSCLWAAFLYEMSGRKHSTTLRMLVVEEN